MRFYSTGGVALVYVGQPLDTVKVKMQTFPTMYNGMVNCFLRTLRSDGIARGLYAGTIPAVVANVAENSVLFAAYGGCQKAIAHLTGIYFSPNSSTITVQFISDITWKEHLQADLHRECPETLTILQ